MTSDRDLYKLCCILNKEIKTTKMADSIAGELLSNINAIPFKQIIPALHNNSGIPEVMFSCTTLAKQFIVDTCCWLDGSYMHPNVMFKYFGLYSNDMSKQVHKAMIKYLGLNKKKGLENCAILKNTWIVLALQGKDAKMWSEDMKKIDTSGDEIALYTLCKMYHHHCVVFTKMKSWCTIDTDSGIAEENFVDNCDIILLFREAGVYGELKTRPFAPPPKQAILQDATADLPKNSTCTNLAGNGTLSALDLCAQEEHDVVTNSDNIANGNNQSCHDQEALQNSLVEKQELPSNEQESVSSKVISKRIDPDRSTMMNCTV